VLDPVAVEIAALENACSAASKLIRIGGAVAFIPTPSVEESLRSIMGDNDDGGRIQGRRRSMKHYF
jgi:hypothetical protein